MFDQPAQLLDFMPDADPRVVGAILDCSNVKGTSRGIVPAKKFDEVGRIIPPGNIFQLATLPSQPMGAATLTLSDGRQMTLAGTLPLIYLFDQNNREWVSHTVAPILSSSRFRYGAFGLDIIATNAVSPPLISQNGAPFVPLSSVSTLPVGYIASTVAVVDEGIFLIQAGTDSWRFSLSPYLWTPSVAQGVVQSGVPGVGGPGGPITAAMRCRGGVAFYKANSLSLGRFTGPPFFWSFITISENVGSAWQESVINAGDLHLFISQDDFWIFDGSSLTRIPNQLKDWFFARITATQPFFPTGTPFPTVIGRWDATRGTAIWHFATINAAPGTYDEWIAYNLRDNKWTRGEQLVSDVLIDSLPTIDAIERTVLYRSAVFNVQNTLLQEGDLNAASYILTGEFGDGVNYFQVSRLRPIFAKYPTREAPPELGSGESTYLPVKLQAFKRRTFGRMVPDPDPFPEPGVGPSAYLTRDGFFNMIQTARSHQFRLDFPEGLDYEITAVMGDFKLIGED